MILIVGALKSNEVGVKPFGCGVVSEEIGAHVSLASKEKHKIKRPKKESALTKHRKWLAELQETKDRLELEFVQEMQQKKETQEKFKKQERKLRETTIAIMNPDDSKTTDENMSPTMSNAYSKDAKDEIAKKIKSKRPAWAKAEGSKSETDDELAQLIGGEGEDISDLLDFAKGLDYDKYMNDLEIKTMMEQVRKRISDLERQVNQEEKRYTDIETDKARREILALRELSKGPQYTEDEYEEVDEEEVNLEAAKDILKQNEDIKSIHSAKSASTLIKHAKEGAAQPKHEPIIIVHDPNEGTRLNPEAKNALSNLPYMHRNPAI